MNQLLIEQQKRSKTHGKRQGYVSYEDYLALDHDAKRIEWVNGEVIIHMPATDMHQNIAGFLYVILSTFVNFYHLGRVMIAPFEMRHLPGRSSREPDVLFVHQANIQRMTEKRVEGPADLVIEVISGDSVTRDRKIKFAEYAESGVREYWVIDPRIRKQQADFYVLTDIGRYRPVHPDQAGNYYATVIPGFWFPVNWLWQHPFPLIRDVFKHIAPAIVQDEDALRAAELRGEERGIEQGRAEGIEQGRAEGIEQGRAEGIEQGEMQALERLVRLMLADGVDLPTIMKYTGLTAEQIAEIGQCAK